MPRQLTRPGAWFLQGIEEEESRDFVGFCLLLFFINPLNRETSFAILGK
jgi:hypothetical protein